MIQDIFPRKIYNQYDKNAKPCEADLMLCFDGSKVLIKDTFFANGEVVFPRGAEMGNIYDYTYLFAIDYERFFLARMVSKVPDGFGFVDAKTIRKNAAKMDYHVFAVMTGKHLSEWYDSSLYCGRCGERMVHSETERAMICTSCKHTVYPRIMPAVIVGVKNQDKLLVTKYHGGTGGQALIAGFTEIGETLEETVAREVLEEVGLRVKNISYYKSQPWGIAGDILMGFYCDVEGETEILMDTEELQDAQWVDRQHLKPSEKNDSLTSEMIKKFKEREIR